VREDKREGGKREKEKGDLPLKIDDASGEWSENRLPREVY